ncbi:SDR family oxidoreductase [Sphingobium indicum]|uniref:SDR family oxidoreductase n=1 Tax=Sphingobium indicum TaxID=332055 RepID=UPI000935EA79|nr:sugar nucleotide-binding protein [Sphingobium indicum]
MPDVLIAGPGGMLGSGFTLRFPNAISIGRASLDIRQTETIQETIAKSKARWIINCAAHTNVDLAETAIDDAWRVNALLPGILGTACRAAGATLVHFSSTGVYGNWKQSAYEEDDPLQPTTVHHRSKAAGEAAVRDSGCEHLIIRTGWLFGGHPGQPKNFVWKRIVEAANCRELKSDPSQRGNPTAVSDVVTQTLSVLHSGYRGTLNLVSQGSASRMDYVRRIVRSAGLDCRVSPGNQPFARAARVSPNEVAVNKRLQLLGLDRMPTWEDAVDQYVIELQQSSEWLQLRARA